MDLLRLNTLRDTKTAFLIAKRYDEYPRLFYKGVAPHSGLSTNEFGPYTFSKISSSVVLMTRQSDKVNWPYFNLATLTTISQWPVNSVTHRVGRFREARERWLSLCLPLKLFIYLSRAWEENDCCASSKPAFERSLVSKLASSPSRFFS